MATQPKPAGLTYEDLQGFPDDNMRREIIDGELFVSPAPGGRHQDAVAEILFRLVGYVKEHGGKAHPAPRDVRFADTSVVEPDVLYVAPENLGRSEERFVRGAPDIAVEVSSPSTRRLEIVRKLELYERFGVREYWYVDLEADRVEIHRLEDGRYGHPRMLRRGDTVTSPILPGLEIPVEDVLGPAEG